MSPLIGVYLSDAHDLTDGHDTQIDFADAFGIAVEQPSARERREHRAARTQLVKSPDAASTARGTAHEEDS